MIDLSFTQDQAWIEQRMQRWLPIRKSLSDTFRKKELDQLEKYALAGEMPDRKLEDSTLLLYFPLQSPEGWNYVFQNMITKPESFEDAFYERALRDHHQGLITLEQELELWDYFVGEKYEPIIRSRVPLKPTGQIAELRLDAYRVASIILNMLVRYCRYAEFGNYPKWLVKIDYLYSLLGILNEAPILDQKRVEKTNKMMTSLLNMAVDFQCEEKADDPEQHREKFLKSFAEKVGEISNLPAPLRQIWEERKDHFPE